MPSPLPAVELAVGGVDMLVVASQLPVAHAMMAEASMLPSSVSSGFSSWLSLCLRTEAVKMMATATKNANVSRYRLKDEVSKLSVGSSGPDSSLSKRLGT